MEQDEAARIRALGASAQDEAARIRALGEIVHEFDLESLRVRMGEAEYELVRREPATAPQTPVSAAPLPPIATNGTTVAAAPPAPAPSGASDRTQKVLAPVVGVFYRSSNPGTEPFVSAGDRVTVGQTLCILEAMKLMNEITSDYAGLVTRILPENGELVRLNEELFWIEP